MEGGIFRYVIYLINIGTGPKLHPFSWLNNRFNMHSDNQSELCQVSKLMSDWPLDGQSGRLMISLRRSRLIPAPHDRRFRRSGNPGELLDSGFRRNDGMAILQIGKNYGIQYTYSFQRVRKFEHKAACHSQSLRPQPSAPYSNSSILRRTP